MKRKHDPQNTTERSAFRAAIYGAMLTREGYDADEVRELVRQRYPRVRVGEKNNEQSAGDGSDRQNEMA